KNVVNVSHHLSVLKTAGLIRGVKRGRFVDYSLESGVLEGAVEAGVPKEALDLGCCRLELPIADFSPERADCPPRRFTRRAAPRRGRTTQPPRNRVPRRTRPVV